jgi:hypothetical protein
MSELSTESLTELLALAERRCDPEIGIDDCPDCAKVMREFSNAFDPSTCAALVREVIRLRECHATKGTHTIDCAMAQKQAGTWGKKG